MSYLELHVLSFDDLTTNVQVIVDTSTVQSEYLTFYLKNVIFLYCNCCNIIMG